MLALPSGQSVRLPIEAISQWRRAWISGASVSELKCFGEEEITLIAKDVGVSASELRRFASLSPDSADLLLHRMAALDLDRKEVSRIERGTFQDLLLACAMCDSHRLCARGLARDTANSAWKDYCPNTAKLMELDAMPWAARREW